MFIPVWDTDETQPLCGKVLRDFRIFLGACKV